MGSVEQRLECPICQEVMTLRGLHGHLRIKHSKTKEEIMGLIEQAPADQGEATEEVFNLLDMIKHLKGRDLLIDVLSTRKCFEREDVEEQLRESIRNEARPYFARLRELGVALDDDDISAYCSVVSERSSEQMEKEE
ncbi:MAG: hypothetical protein U0412_07615 [Nitrospira sp.]